MNKFLTILNAIQWDYPVKVFLIFIMSSAFYVSFAILICELLGRRKDHNIKLNRKTRNSKKFIDLLTGIAKRNNGKSSEEKIEIDIEEILQEVNNNEISSIEEQQVEKVEANSVEETPEEIEEVETPVIEEKVETTSVEETSVEPTSVEETPEEIEEVETPVIEEKVETTSVEATSVEPTSVEETLEEIEEVETPVIEEKVETTSVETTSVEATSVYDELEEDIEDDEEDLEEIEEVEEIKKINKERLFVVKPKYKKTEFYKKLKELEYRVQSRFYDVCDEIVLNEAIALKPNDNQSFAINKKVVATFDIKDRRLFLYLYNNQHKSGIKRRTKIRIRSLYSVKYSKELINKIMKK